MTDWVLKVGSDPPPGVGRQWYGWDPLEQPLHQKVFPGQRVVPVPLLGEGLTAAPQAFWPGLLGNLFFLNARPTPCFFGNSVC